VKLRQRIEDEYKKYDLPTPSYPGKDRDLIDRLKEVPVMNDNDLRDYQIRLNAFWNYYTFQAIQKKHEITELEYEYDMALYYELENVDNKLYKTIKEREHKALNQNTALKELYENLLDVRAKQKTLEGLEKIFDKTLYTVSREITRRIEIMKGKDGHYGHSQ